MWFSVCLTDLFEIKNQKMKKTIFILVLTIPFAAGIIFTGYRSSTQEKKAAQTKVLYADRDLNAARRMEIQ